MCIYRQIVHNFHINYLCLLAVSFSLKYYGGKTCSLKDLKLPQNTICVFVDLNRLTHMHTHTHNEIGHL